jgi:hypothetical protein
MGEAPVAEDHPQGLFQLFMQPGGNPVSSKLPYLVDWYWYW